jgi:O-antigen/teichoic acid export membrane protein
MKLRQFGNAVAPKGSFKADVLTLMTGTAIAQLITIAISPVLTRLFTPEAFGALGLYLSFLAIAGAVVTLRFDQALMLPKDTEIAAALFWDAILSVGVISGFSLLGCVLFFKQLLSILKLREWSAVIFLLPLSLILFGTYATLNSWSARQKEFGRSSISQVVRSLSASGVQMFSGLLKAGSVGLIGGALAGDCFAALALAWQVKRDDWPILKRSLAWGKMKCAAWQYREFPIFSSTQNLLNALSQNMPLLLLAKFFGPAVTGFYVLGVRGIQIPMNFYLTSLRQVFFQRASELYNQGGDTYALFKKTTLSLLVLAAIPALAIFLFGPGIFAFAFGRKWIVAGEYARWLVLWLTLMFANVPAVLFAQIYRKQKAVLLQDIFLLTLRVLAIVIGGLRRSPLLAVVLYSLVGVFFNLFIILWVRNLLRRGKRTQ